MTLTKNRTPRPGTVTIDVTDHAHGLGHLAGMLGDTTVPQALDRYEQALNGRPTPLNVIILAKARAFLAALDRAALPATSIPGVDSDTDLAQVDDATLAQLAVVATDDSQALMDLFRAGFADGVTHRAQAHADVTAAVTAELAR